MAAQLIVGLGNPGPKYLWTRHNAGFIVLDRFARQAGIPLTRKSFGGLYGEGNHHGSKLLLLEPQTFMNLSGRSVAEAVRFHKLTPADLIVIHDDLDIPFGQLKIKEEGGHGGHNGLRSIMQELGTGQFVRLRIGVGRPERGDAAAYVLTNFSSAEMADLGLLVEGAQAALQSLLDNGVAKAMSLFNNRNLLVP